MKFVPAIFPGMFVKYTIAKVQGTETSPNLVLCIAVDDDEKDTLRLTCLDGASMSEVAYWYNSKRWVLGYKNRLLGMVVKDVEFLDSFDDQQA